MGRYLTLLGIQLRASLTSQLQYRFDFVVEGLMTAFWAVVTVTPLLVVYGDRQSVAGWSFAESLVVVGWFTLLKGVLEGAINPSLLGVVDHVRKGTLDFVLLKPADAQFLVSTSKFDPWRLFDVASATTLFVIAFRRLGRWPSGLDVLAALGLLIAAVVVLYSIWILVISVAFYAVRVDNLSHLFNSIFDAARWPISVFKGVVRFVFTFVFPLALMTSYPAMALLGRLDFAPTVEALLGGVVFALIARAVWSRALGAYTSASS